MVTKENIETTPDITDTIDAVTKKVTVSSDETVNKVAAPVKKSRKTKQIIQHGQAHIFASFNNTIISITDGK
jgi:hypothetical protein